MELKGPVRANLMRVEAREGGPQVERTAKFRLGCCTLQPWTVSRGIYQAPNSSISHFQKLMKVVIKIGQLMVEKETFQSNKTDFSDG